MKLAARVAATFTCAGCVLPQSSFASGFALLEQSASRLGTAFSGTAAVGEDASANFYNPATLTQLEAAEVAVVGSGIKISSEFRDSGSQAAFGQSLGHTGGDAGGWNPVPSAYFAAPFSSDLVLGFGFNVPFGLKLEYDSGWIGRFQALDSEIKTYNFNPSIAWRVNDALSAGLGLNYQRMQAELTNSVNYAAVIAQAATQMAAAGLITQTQATQAVADNLGVEERAIVRGDDATWGFNVGFTYQLSERTRVGVAYRSSSEYDVEGSARFVAPQAQGLIAQSIVASLSASGQRFETGPASVDLELPAIATASLAHEVSDAVELFADVAWTEWSRVQELRVVRPSGVEVSTTPEHWDDTWRVALGLAYHLRDSLTLRVGVAHDETPVPNATRTARLPDADRIWLAIGARWRPSEAISIDAGYAHLFSDDAPLNQDQASVDAFGLLAGEQESAVDIVSVQVGVKF